MEQILLICGGAFIGFLIGGLLSTATRCDNEVLEAHIQLLLGKLREEEQNNKLLQEANEAIMDDYNKLVKLYNEKFEERKTV